MSRIGECLQYLEENGITTISRPMILAADFYLEGRRLPKELKKDIERAERIEVLNYGSEATGYVGNKIVFTAGGDFDNGTFRVDSYYSKEFMLGRKTNGKVAPNTVNPNAFNA